jgi:hypothetical protein
MTCLAEIVDPNSASNDASEGPIALTTLAPFHRGTLLIRYQNGDFVRRVRDDWDSPFSATFKFLGRAGQCLDLTQFVGQGEDARYLGTAEAQEALDRFPEVPYVYYPRFRFDLEPGPRLQVSVEVYSCFGGLRDQRLRERIIEALISTSPALAAAVRTSHLDVDVQLFQPDDLDHAFRLNP